MGRNASADRLIASRYECKYFISRHVADEVRRRIHPFVVPDKYAASHAGFRYVISSLYLDDSDLVLYQQTLQGLKNRFKLRIRSYSDDPDLPVYLEIKKRVNTVLLKRRAPICAREVSRWLDEGCSRTALTRVGAGPAAEEFAELACRLGAKPVLRVRYVREAYESSGMDPVRITFDTDLMYAVTTDGTLGLSNGQWWSTPAEGVILEIKFTERFPSWVRSLIDGLQLQKQSIPKYCLSVKDAIDGGRYDVPSARASAFERDGRQPSWRF